MPKTARPWGALLFWYGQFLARYRMNGLALEVYRAVTRDDPRHQQARRSSTGFPFADRGEHDKVRIEYPRMKGFGPKVAERIRVEFGVSDKP